MTVINCSCISKKRQVLAKMELVSGLREKFFGRSHTTKCSTCGFPDGFIFDIYSVKCP